jgi:hypothetical protein
VLYFKHFLERCARPVARVKPDAGQFRTVAATLYYIRPGYLYVRPAAGLAQAVFVIHGHSPACRAARSAATYQNPLELDVKFAVLIRGQGVTAYGTLANGHPLANGRPAYVHQYDYDSASYILCMS